MLFKLSQDLVYVCPFCIYSCLLQVIAVFACLLLIPLVRIIDSSTSYHLVDRTIGGEAMIMFTGMSRKWSMKTTRANKKSKKKREY